jgi:hypothetical protein
MLLAIEELGPGEEEVGEVGGRVAALAPRLAKLADVRDDLLARQLDLDLRLVRQRHRGPRARQSRRRRRRRRRTGDTRREPETARELAEGRAQLTHGREPIATLLREGLRHDGVDPRVDVASLRRR